MSCNKCSRKANELNKQAEKKTETEVKDGVTKVISTPIFTPNTSIPPKNVSVSFPFKKIIIKNMQSPGDILMLSAAIRDLHIAYPGSFKTDVRVPTGAREIFQNNPNITSILDDDKEAINIQAEYPLIHKSDKLPRHFVEGFHSDLSKKLGINIPITDFKGDIHLSEQEKGWISQIREFGIKDNFWIINAGGKYDFTSKLYNPDSYQEVVDYFRGKITFVQIGEQGHFHPELKGVINLIGKTNTRQLIRLVYHSYGVLCPVTFVMHLAAALPVKANRPPKRACVVLAGGREPAHWEAYPGHRYLSNHGSLECNANGGCWKSRCQEVGDGDIKDIENKCVFPVEKQLTKVSLPISIPQLIKNQNGMLKISKCMDMITPKDVIRAIESYYEGGYHQYGSSIKDKNSLPESLKDNVKF